MSIEKDEIIIKMSSNDWRRIFYLANDRLTETKGYSDYKDNQKAVNKLKDRYKQKEELLKYMNKIQKNLTLLNSIDLLNKFENLTIKDTKEGLTKDENKELNYTYKEILRRINKE